MTGKARVPFIDPTVAYRGISSLRQMNIHTLRTLDQTIVVGTDREPLVVILPFRTFQLMQQLVQKENAA